MKYNLPLLLLTLCMLGCSGHVPLTGTVVYSDNGEPLPLGTITLSNATFQSRSSIDAQGHFTMGSYDIDDGLPPGEYKVSILGVYPDADTSGLITHDLIDHKWSHPETSGYTVIVEKGMKSLEIKVDRPSKQSPRRW